MVYISDDMSLATLNDDFLLNFALFSLFGMRSIFPHDKLSLLTKSCFTQPLAPVRVLREAN